jgi:hypothetical protein
VGATPPTGRPAIKEALRISAGCWGVEGSTGRGTRARRAVVHQVGGDVAGAEPRADVEA